jgi:hypothetical protein
LGSFVDATELALNPIDLTSGRRALLTIQIQHRRCRHPPLHSVDDGGYHLQVS